MMKQHFIPAVFYRDIIVYHAVRIYAHSGKRIVKVTEIFLYKIIIPPETPVYSMPFIVCRSISLPNENSILLYEQS